MKTCNLCFNETYALYDPEIKVTYAVCDSCGFTYKPPKFHVEASKEKALYDNHQNTMENEGYVNMFKRFLNQGVYPFIDSGAALEYGSGPGPVLYELLKRAGFAVDHYDPFYHPNETVFSKTYDLITSTEVFEHFHDPQKEIKTLSAILNKGGYLAIMTSFRPLDDDAFLKWWYRRDKTHVSFYTLRALDLLARAHGLYRLSTNHKNIVTYRKE